MSVTFPNRNDLSTPSGSWQNGAPIFHVLSANELNRLIGQVKYINADVGTVLYRGQNELYPELLPSILRNPDALNKNVSRLSNACSVICECPDLSNLVFGKNEYKPLKRWNFYHTTAIEALFQHYGAKTFCLDFVDSHWPALWFGLYQFDPKSSQYSARKSGNQYLLLYVAQTRSTEVHGMYLGQDEITMDLRRLFSSVFLRPSAQHGWAVRKIDGRASFNENVACVIELDVHLAKQLLGDGQLTGMDNFFPLPEEDADVGYLRLLERQKKSRLWKGRRKGNLPSGFLTDL